MDGLPLQSKPPSHPATPTVSSAPEPRRRVVRACQRCRLKKCKVSWRQHFPYNSQRFPINSQHLQFNSQRSQLNNQCLQLNRQRSRPNSLCFQPSNLHFQPSNLHFQSSSLCSLPSNLHFQPSSLCSLPNSLRPRHNRQLQQHQRPQPHNQIAALCFHIRQGVQQRPVLTREK